MMWKCLFAGAVTCFGFHQQLQAETQMREKVRVRVMEVLGCDEEGLCRYTVETENADGDDTQTFEVSHVEKREFPGALLTQGQVLTAVIRHVARENAPADSYLQSIASLEEGAFAEGLSWVTVKVGKTKDCRQLDKREKLYECVVPVTEVGGEGDAKEKALLLSYLDARKDAAHEGDLALSLSPGKTYQVLLAAKPAPFGGEHRLVLTSTLVKKK